MKKTFEIPVTWEMFGVIKIEADTLDEAIKHFDDFEKIEGYNLPLKGEYVDGSFNRADEETCSINNLDKL